MAENLFILGAGASFDAGAPLMNGFLDKAYELLLSGAAQPYNKEFEDVFHLLKELRLVYANSHLDLNNIESLFGAIEMGRIINILGPRTNDSIENVRNSLVRLIVTTLEKSIIFDYDGDHVRPTKSYNRFVELIRDKTPSSSIVTFNYDYALDYALNFYNINFNYCVDTSQVIHELKLMKLHGSVNWAMCRSCKSIIPIRTIHRNAISRRVITIQFNNIIGHQEHQCSNGTRSGTEDIPVIVPPTWNKKDYHGNLTNVWRHAATELSTARNIYIIGYSLPESDAFFRYLFALGTFDNAQIKRLWVYNPDETAETKARYTALLGRGLDGRYEYKAKKFDEALEELSKLL